MSLFTSGTWDDGFSCYIFTGALSVAGSIAVLATGYLFPTMVKKKVFSQMILCLSFCNLMLGASQMFGYPMNHYLCFAQSLSLNFSAKGSWIMCIFISLQLRNLLNNGNLLMTPKWMIVIFLAMQLLSMTMPVYRANTNYGNFPAFLGDLQCVVYAGAIDVWYDTLFLCYTLWLLIVMIILSVNAYLLHRDQYILKLRLNSESFKKATLLRRSANAYPIIILVVYLPQTVVTFVFYTFMNKHDTSSLNHRSLLLLGIVNSWSNLDGFFSACAYFYYGKEARRRWRELLQHYTMGHYYLRMVDSIYLCLRGIWRSCQRFISWLKCEKHIEHPQVSLIDGSVLSRYSHSITTPLARADWTRSSAAKSGQLETVNLATHNADSQKQEEKDEEVEQNDMEDDFQEHAVYSRWAAGTSVLNEGGSCSISENKEDGQVSVNKSGSSQSRATIVISESPAAGVVPTYCPEAIRDSASRRQGETQVARSISTEL